MAPSPGKGRVGGGKYLMQTQFNPHLLRADSVSLDLAGQKILDRISCELRAGEFVGLIGPNGAGKSSLLKIFTGLQQASSGSVEIHNQNSNQELRQEIHQVSRKQRARWIGWLPQQEKPAWPLSVENLVALGRLPWQGFFANTSSDQQSVDRAIEQAELQPLRQRNIQSLSGGELQRALLARLFAGDQQFLLLDEPIVALDPYHQLHLMQLLKEKSQQQHAVCAALHDLNLAAAFCDKLILLNHGQLVATGSPADVLTNENLRKVYAIEAYVDCRDEGVVIIPRKRFVKEGARP